jgi:hypothetical protein
MPAAVSFRTIRASKPFGGDILLGVVFALPIAALVLAFTISTRGDQGIVAQIVEQVASYQM